MQMCRRTFNIKVLVLSRPTFRGKECATVDFLEVPIRKFVPFLCIFVFLVVDSQVPISVLAEPVCVNEVVFLFAGRLVFAPRVSVIHHDFSSIDKFFGVLERLPIQFDRHAYLLSSRFTGHGASSGSTFLAL
jgi:hypothetical protein